VPYSLKKYFQEKGQQAKMPFSLLVRGLLPSKGAGYEKHHKKQGKVIEKSKKL
jgi:hypothetical protein